MVLWRQSRATLVSLQGAKMVLFEVSMASKTADAIKLVLRLPKPLHKRLKQQARRNNVSLNTEIVNQLSPPKGSGIPFYVLKEIPPALRDLRGKMETLLRERGLPEPVPCVIATDLEAAKTRIAALEDEVAHLRGQAESEGRVQDMRAVEREKGEEQK